MARSKGLSRAYLRCPGWFGPCAWRTPRSGELVEILYKVIVSTPGCGFRSTISPLCPLEIARSAMHSLAYISACEAPTISRYTINGRNCFDVHLAVLGVWSYSTQDDLPAFELWTVCSSLPSPLVESMPHPAVVQSIMQHLCVFLRRLGHPFLLVVLC